MRIKGVLCGLHFQKKFPQTKLVGVIKARVLDAAVDLRKDSETAQFCYNCDNFYHANDEGGLSWNDPTIGVQWPEVVGEYHGCASAEGYVLADSTALKLSEKDQNWPSIDR